MTTQKQALINLLEDKNWLEQLNQECADRFDSYLKRNYIAYLETLIEVVKSWPKSSLKVCAVLMKAAEVHKSNKNDYILDVLATCSNGMLRIIKEHVNQAYKTELTKLGLPEEELLTDVKLPATGYGNYMFYLFMHFNKVLHPESIFESVDRNYKELKYTLNKINHRPKELFGQYTEFLYGKELGKQIIQWGQELDDMMDDLNNTNLSRNQRAEELLEALDTFMIEFKEKFDELTPKDYTPAIMYYIKQAWNDKTGEVLENE